jgi:PST family polysaccharide transporter
MVGPETEPAPPAPQEDPRQKGRFTLKAGTTLRQHAARGTIVNAVFNSGITILGFLKGFILAAFLAPSDYGIWGILLISLGTLAWLKQVGISDKYIQQDEADQEAAFQKAFTMELVVNGILLAVLLVAVPLMALVYGRPELLAPGFALCALVPAGQLQVPFWVLYRRLEFRRQRLLQAIDPLIAFAASVALAIAGAGYWAFILGALAGSWAGALVALRTSPYPLKLRYDRGTLRSYAQFSAPLFVASVGGIVVAQGSIFFGEHAAGLVAAGAITLAAQIFQLAQRVDDVITSTLYPVIASVRDRREVLYETFEKSNRLALMWAMPFGIGLALFASDLVSFVIGDEWQPAVHVLQATGVAAAVSQLGFNWTSYCRALNNTRPIAVNAIAVVIGFLAINVPLLYWLELDGYAIGVLVMVAINLVTRSIYLARLFSGFGMARHAIRAVAPSLPAAGLVLLVRAADSGTHRSAWIALLEIAVFGIATAASTWLFERDLIREAVGYVRRGSPAAPAAT